jgi:DNA-directed RNA polymerase subunit E'/Rpb7
MDSPYFNTYLRTRVALQASQMDNNIYRHLKDNLIRKHLNRCFNNYGYIQKIYKIEEKTGGEIIAEDPTAGAVYDIKFSCKLCRPLIGSTIVCEIMNVNKAIIFSKNGPIFVILEEQNINQENFIFDDRRNVLLAKIKNKGIPVVKGTYVKIKITGAKILHNSDQIVATGKLESIATDKERDKSLEDIEKEDGDIIEYSERESQIVEIENESQIVENESESDTE